LDSGGNLYILDGGNNSIRKVAPSGIISTVGGNGPGDLGDNRGSAASDHLSYPVSIAVDIAGNIYVCDSYRIRKVTPGGAIINIAGNGIRGYSGDGGPAISAQIGSSSVAVDVNGDVYIGDSENFRIRKVNYAGIITTVAGNGSEGDSGDGGPATSAQLNSLYELALDSAGNLFIADTNNGRVRKVTPAGMITTVAGNGTDDFGGDGGPAVSAPLTRPESVAVDSKGNLFIADTVNNRIRMVTLDGIINTVGGNGTHGYSGDGGRATSALLNRPEHVTVDSAGNLYIADIFDKRIRKVTPAGVITTVAGNGTQGLGGDGGRATSAQLSYPQGMTVDSANNLYIADSGRVRKVSPAGVITTVAGKENGIIFIRDGIPATTCGIYPYDVVVDSGGNLYIAANNRILKVLPSGILLTVAGNGIPGYSGDGGLATEAQLGWASSIAMDSANNLYITDSDNFCVRKVTPGGIITTVAGNGTDGYSGDGGLATEAQLGRPNGLAVDSKGNLYVAHTSYIRRVSSEGIITTIAGKKYVGRISGYNGDGGPSESAQLAIQIGGLAVDSKGNLYVADAGNSRVRKITTPSR
jgi:sugar lactone lactonase YvrE